MLMTTVSGQQSDDLQGMARRIFLTSAASGIATMAIITTLAFWMALQVNMLSHDALRKQVETSITAELDNIVISTLDYAFWDFAYDAVMTGQDDALYANFGTGASTSDTFDFIYVVDTTGAPVYAYQSDVYESDLSIVDAKLATTLYKTVTTTPFYAGKAIKQFTFANNRLAAIAAAPIRPGDIGPEDTADAAGFPVMIAGRFITPDVLDAIAQRLLLQNLSLNGGADGMAAPRKTFTLRDAAGRPLATLAWDAPNPGAQLLAVVLPVIAVLCLLSAFATATVGRASARQTTEIIIQRQIARTDRLTGLANRAGLDELMSGQTITDAIARDGIAIINLDLNNFKELNDSEGHEAGDKALQIFAARIRRALRANDTIVRMGGDEFICILIDDRPAQTAKVIAHRIANETSQPIRIGTKNYHISPSIGVAVGTNGMTWQQLEKNADRAMYRAKRTTKQGPVFYWDDKGTDASGQADYV